jgi:hypothetical protein
MATITKTEIVSELLKTEKWKDYKQSTLMGKTKDILLKLLEESKGSSVIIIDSVGSETSIPTSTQKKKTSKKATAEDKNEEIASLAQVDFTSVGVREMIGTPKTIKSGTITMTYTMWKNPFYVARPELPEIPKAKGRAAKSK